MSDDPITVVERLFAAIEAGDVEAIRRIYSPDAEIWHNFDGVVQSADENLRTLEWVTANVRDLRYEDVKRIRTEIGVVQQHVLRGIAPSGKTVSVPACIVFTVDGDRITRLDEYLDTAQTAPL